MPDATQTGYTKSTLHTLAPYVGKLRPNVAYKLITEFSKKGEVVFDPFCGSGTVALEAWLNNRMPLATDLNYYAYIVTLGKLNPIKSHTEATTKLLQYCSWVEKGDAIELGVAPQWVQMFFNPITLQEIQRWVHVLKTNEEWFFLACLMGILHHQRPGFLSYPSSHGAPYLRLQKFPKDKYPELYEYRNVGTRMQKKVDRIYKQQQTLDFSIPSVVHYCNTLELSAFPQGNITIITSPPYMRSLTYARDNRLRLWFLGVTDWVGLDKEISMEKNEFLDLMSKCFQKWNTIQEIGMYCVLIVGDIVWDKKSQLRLPQAICDVAVKHGYSLEEMRDYPTNLARKVVKKASQINTEKICILKRGNNDEKDRS
ncbi:MAG: site-specific DNA-methyltransferase [Clostridiales bacterium]|nr:site-specific DNA-methyltransferase [Clostridiales bacterium]